MKWSQKNRSSEFSDKTKKIVFRQHIVHLHVPVVSRQGITVDEGKIISILNAEIPAMITELRGFLGLASYYRWLIKDFAKIEAMSHADTAANSLLLVERYEQCFQTTDREH